MASSLADSLRIRLLLHPDGFVFHLAQVGTYSYDLTLLA